METKKANGYPKDAKLSEHERDCLKELARVFAAAYSPDALMFLAGALDYAAQQKHKEGQV